MKLYIESNCHYLRVNSKHKQSQQWRCAMKQATSIWQFNEPKNNSAKRKLQHSQYPTADAVKWHILVYQQVASRTAKLQTESMKKRKENK